MRLTTTSFLVSAVAATLVAVCAFVATEFVLVQSVALREEAATVDRMHAVLGVIDDDLSRLDDALRAALNAPPTLGPWGVEAPGVQYAVILNDAGEIRGTRAYVSDAEDIVPPAVLQQLAQEPAMGVVASSQGLALVAARDRETGGVMAVAARLIPTRLATISGIPVELRGISTEPEQGEDFVFPVTSVEARLRSTRIDEGHVEVLGHIRDIFGEFGPILAARFPAPATEAATNGVIWVVSLLAGALALVFAGANLSLNHAVGRKLGEFAKRVHALRNSHGAGKPVPVRRSDELAPAAEDINGLARSLSVSRADCARRIEFVRALASIAERVAADDPTAVDAAVRTALRAMARHEDADRCWWYLMDDDDEGFDLKSEWTAENARAHGSLLRKLDAGSYPWLYRQLSRGDVVHITRVENLPQEAEPERAGFAAMGATSVTAVPIPFGGGVSAVIGIDSIREEKTWSEGMVTALRVVGHMLVMSLGHRELAEFSASAAEQAAESRRVAEEANATRTEIMENLSRELRTPVNGTLEMTELALGTELTVEQRGYLAAARDSAQAMLGLVDEFLEFSRLEADQLEFEQLDFDVRAAVEAAIDTVNHLAMDKGLEILCRIDPAVPSHLRGDPTRLRQILANLLSNAVQYTSQGFVRVDVGLASSSKGMAVMLHGKVTDTGRGIPEGVQETIFDADVDEPDAVRTGTGMSLAITRLLVRKMAGRIWLDSTEGQGSTFEFTALVEKSPETVPAEFGPDAADALRRLRVLIVDDSAENRLILRSYAESWRSEVLEAGSEREACRILQSETNEYNPVSVVLLDAELPGAAPLDMVRRFAVDVSLGKPAVVVFSTYRREADKRPFVDAGAAAYLTKPVRAVEMLRALLSSSRNRRSRTAVSQRG